MTDQTRNPLARRQSLRHEISRRGTVSVTELCDLLGASPATIRRDLAALEKDGFISRGYGGATIRSIRQAEQTLAVREQSHIVEKQAIARAVIGLIKSGDTLFINDGSTMLPLVHDLALMDLELFIATPAINIAQILADNPNITVCLLGGFLRRSSLATDGHFAETMVEQINADLALLSCDGFSITGGMCFSHAGDAALAGKMTLKAKRSIALVHHAKFDWQARITGVPLSSLDVLVTENLHPDLVSKLTNANIEVINPVSPAL